MIELHDAHVILFDSLDDIELDLPDDLFQSILDDFNFTF